jgi:two-component sensor histidine kinase
MDKSERSGRLGAFVRRGLEPMSPAAFGFALLCVVAATLLRLAIGIVAPDALPYAIYFPAVLLAAFIAGAPAGVLATLGSAAAAWYLFVPPYFSIAHAGQADFVSLGLFLVAALAIVWIADRYRSLIRRLDEEEAYRKVVVEELGHRVKNKLATVYAILRHELRGHRDVWESVAGRLQALSTADDFLVSGDGAGVEFAQIVATELAPYGSASVSMRGGPLTLHGKLPSVMALIVHELVTNAAKYGALSAPDGVIDIEWTEDGDDIVVTWRERGGPPVTPPTRRSFGTSLIERSLDAFRGSARLEFAPSGVVCRLRFAKASTAAPR